MTQRLMKAKAVLSGHVTVEAAASLLQWMIEHPNAELHMAGVTHLHAAAIQAIAATNNRIAIAPEDPFCAKALARLGRT
jgi:hypothetical protein